MAPDPREKWQLKLLRLFCKPDYLEEIAGDLLERFHKNNRSNLSANWCLWIEVLKLIRPKMLKSFIPKTNHNVMLSHHIIVSFRSFKRHRVSFLINYLGLVGGLVSVLLICLWVNHELGVDRFHKNEGSIYRLVSGNGNTSTILNTNPDFAWELEATIPEIEYVVNSCWGPLYSHLNDGENAFAVRGEFGSDRFFELFSYPLLIGDPTTVFEQPNAIVLSEATAFKLFNSTDVIGQQLEWRWYSHHEKVTITGIYKDLPVSSSEQFDYVLNFEVYDRGMSERTRRGRNGRTYVKLTDGASMHAVNQKIHDYTRKTYPAYQGAPYVLIDYADHYLKGEYENGVMIGGRYELIRLFIVIGSLILVIACINFMNLSTARAALRAKEIGVRKTMGALRKALVTQFLTEACLISLLAGISAIALLFAVVPLFSQLLNQPLPIPFNKEIVLGFFSVILLTGLLSGSYPALYLSGFHPLTILRGTFAASPKDQWLRKGLVIFQFGTSLILIIAVLVVYQQMQFIQTKSLGYQKDFIINFRTTGMNGARQQSLLEEVRKVTGVVKAGGISHALFGIQRSGSNMSWEGKNPDQEVWFEYGQVGYDMMELLEIKLNEGRFFSRDFGHEENKVIINQATKALMETDVAVGKKFTVNERDYEIIGVTEDFHFESLHQAIGPTFLLLNDHNWYMKLAVKLEPKHLQETLTEIGQIYDRFNPGFPFQYAFHDQDRAEQYQTEEKISLLTRYAAALAIFISSLGLFGLVSFIAERKAKEISIRKVLGAPLMALIKTLSKDFLLPITTASMAGVIIALFLVQQWLAGFAYRVDLKWWHFGGAVVLMFLITALTSTSQIIRSVWENPIKSLKDE